jgi:hypothetical protein
MLSQLGVEQWLLLGMNSLCAPANVLKASQDNVQQSPEPNNNDNTHWVLFGHTNYSLALCLFVVRIRCPNSNFGLILTRIVGLETKTQPYDISMYKARFFHKLLTVCASQRPNHSQPNYEFSHHTTIS